VAGNAAASLDIPDELLEWQAIQLAKAELAKKMERKRRARAAYAPQPLVRILQAMMIVALLAAWRGSVFKPQEPKPTTAIVNGSLALPSGGRVHRQQRSGV
jgi:hypothetical protein